MITPDREVIPLLVNEDDSVRLPTPEEMKQMRAKDQVRQDLSPLLGGGENMESDLPPAESALYHPSENNPAE